MISAHDLSPEQIALGRAFNVAVKQGDVETVLRVHQRLPEIMTMETGLYPWMCMAACYPSLDMLKTLHSLGANPNLREPRNDPDGKNALNFAASNGHLENLRFLHSIGTEIDTSRPTRNPLFGAVLGRSLPVAQFLLDIGVDATIRYDGYPGPYMDAAAFARESGEMEILAAIARHLAQGNEVRERAILNEADRVAKLNNDNALIAAWNARYGAPES